MSDYSFENNFFVIKDFAKKKIFTNFTPAIAGEKGKPLWLFYTNRGQCITSFGIRDKDSCMLEFSPAFIAYERVQYQGFRTFIRLGKKIYEPFKVGQTSKAKMMMNNEELIIEETNTKDKLHIEVHYFTMPEENYPALIRDVRIKNISDKTRTLEIYDGLASLIPYGLSLGELKSTGNLFRAWMSVENLENGIPFYRLLSSTNDSSLVEDVKSSFFFKAYSSKGDTTRIVDQNIIFGYDTSLSVPVGVEANSFEKIKEKEQITHNQLPCAFLANKVELQPGEEVRLMEIYGWNEKGETMTLTSEDFDFVNEKKKRNHEILNNIVSEISTKTNNSLFDQYIKQCYLDNLLRGGYPIKKGNQIHYIYSRKHGDPERDYNWFIIKPEYYSHGEGNFRDVLQNRRNDLFFHPEVEDYNIRYFMSLVQLDGFNPLVVGGVNFTYVGEKSVVAGISKDKLKNYSLGDLYLLNEKITEEEVNEILHNSIECYTAKTGEGYWCDHFIYLLDLLENYEMVYPDKLKNIWNNRNISYFHTPLVTRSYKNRYILTSRGVRRWDLVDDEKNKDLGLLGYLSDPWFKQNGKTYLTTLASKAFVLIMMKAATLDPYGMGLDIDGGKPGWNDALNGLPGIFGSSVTDLIELYRLTSYVYEKQKEFGKGVILLKEQKEFLDGFIKAYKGKEEDRYFALVDLKETLRSKMRNNPETSEVELTNDEVLKVLELILKTLKRGLNKAISYDEKQMVPTYFYYSVEKYEEIGKDDKYTYVMPKEFKVHTLPHFAEGIAKSFEIPLFNNKSQYNKYVATDGYDHKLKLFKTSESLLNETNQIGRIRTFASGWLERESCFLHMDYKFLLGMLKGGLYKEFFKQIKTNMVPFFSPERYGRSTIENCSFIATSNFKNQSLVGQGFQARLSGANAEFISMWYMLFVGSKSFNMQNDELCFTFNPLVDKLFFDENDEISYKLLTSVDVTLKNPAKLNCYEAKVVELEVHIDGKVIKVAGDTLKGDLAHKLRNKEINKVTVLIG